MSPYALVLATNEDRQCLQKQTADTPQRVDEHAQVIAIIRHFLKRTRYIPPCTPRNAKLRATITECVLSWEPDESMHTLGKLVDSACVITETAYGHTSPVHQHYIALYTAIVLYLDDIGHKHLDAIKQFASRFTRGEKQLSPALDDLVQLMRQSHELFTDVGADAIVSGTFDAVTAMYIEYSTQDMVIRPPATLYPWYLRVRSGICPPYIHFIFMKSWRPTAESYLQLMPYMERWLGGANDILSFYKEHMDGETNNYVTMRADAEATTAVNVLSALAEEALDYSRKVVTLAAGDDELLHTWELFVQGYIEFHATAKRYRLAEIGALEFQMRPAQSQV